MCIYMRIQKGLKRMSEKTFEQILAEAIGTEIRAAYKAIQSENKVHDGVADIYSLIPGSVPNELPRLVIDRYVRRFRCLPYGY